MKQRVEPERPPLEVESFAGTEKYPEGLLIGLDVGSTTVKAVVVDVVTRRTLWKDYQWHETNQQEKVLGFLERIERAFSDVPRNAFRLFVTGSGGQGLIRYVGGKFVQEVNAISLAVESLHPEVQSVVELGGQDAKIIVLREDGDTKRKKKTTTMNDKCAGGTGAVIDKIAAKLEIPPDQVCNMGYHGIKLHPVAGKCGVFAEADINSLQKQGVPPDELMASLFESIIQQNLSVLTRGNTLRPSVLLLGGPNCYIKGMQECWKSNIPPMWEERGVELPDRTKRPEDYVVTPQNAQYFAAIGAVEFAKSEIEDDPNIGLYRGTEALKWYLDHGRAAEKAVSGSRGFWGSREELETFRERYKKQLWEPPSFSPGTIVEAFIGLDGGSTSTKAVLIDKDKKIIAKAYQLSKGNPIEDSIEILSALEKQIEDQGCRMRVLGAATTGYAKDILRDVLGADVALVETVAHSESGLHFYPGADVIVDVGGQDIKLIILKNGNVKDFRLNTQCSAGNGYFLQSTAKAFSFRVEDYAEVAFTAERMPEFGYGCAVFMQSDIVDFQRRGWKPNEIMAGLAAVLPKNIWLYVSKIPNLAKLGTKFILQGGTQHNLAAVKAQVDFIESRFAGTGLTPEIVVHQHCGESGAFGCAMEAHRLWAEHGRETRFIGMERVRRINYRTTRSEATRCYFCKNKCLRTFIDVETGAASEAESCPEAGTKGATGALGSDGATRTENHTPAPVGRAEATQEEVKQGPSKNRSKVPLRPGAQRLIISTCEKGSVEDVDDMREIMRGLEAVKKDNPNLVQAAAQEIFKPVEADDVSDPLPKPSLLMPPGKRVELGRRAELMRRRKQIRIGFPRVLNMYSHAPFFMGFFQSLGVPSARIVFSDYTSEKLYRRGAKRGSIDPCYPSKLGIPHIHDLLHVQHAKKPLTHIFFPMVDSFPTYLESVLNKKACPAAVATVEATYSAFIKECDLFKAKGIVFKKTFLNLDEPQLCARQMFEDWKGELGLSLGESHRAVKQGLRALSDFEARLRAQARAILDCLEREGRIGLVVLARPYHNDPGVNHGVCLELQKLGYPILYQDSLPVDHDLLEPLFGEEIREGLVSSPLSIDDVWKNAYSEHTSRKLWAAKFTARHPNLVALELASFKCGHDAPIYSNIEEIIERSGTPYFCFKDIDENRPAGSIKIRIETIAYFLERYREKLVYEKEVRRRIEAKLAELERQLRAEQPAGPRTDAPVHLKNSLY
jgi:predicted CoA-substrate-specific enzyme activase